MNAFAQLGNWPAVQTLGLTLLHFVWQGLAVALALAALRASGWLASPRARYATACAALALCLVLAVATFVRVSGGGTAVASDRGAGVSAASGINAADAVAPLFSKTPASPALPAQIAPLMPWLVAAWFAGVLLLAVRLLGCWAFTQHLRTRLVKPAGERLQRTLEGIAELLAVSRAVRLLESAAIEAPVVIGWLKPVILLPASVIVGLTPAQLETILAHELAHIRRHDYLVNLLQSLVETLFFYHPAVWWISARIREEREFCCDDLVVSAMGDELLYAEALTELEQHRVAGHRLALAATDGSLVARVQRLLAGTAPVIRVSRPAGALAGAVLLALATAAGVQARAVAEKSRVPESGAILIPQVADDESGLPPALRMTLSAEWTDVSLDEATAAIASQTGLRIHYDPLLGGERITARFVNARATDVLDAITAQRRAGWRWMLDRSVKIEAWAKREQFLAHLAQAGAGRELEKEWFRAGFSPVNVKGEAFPLPAVLKRMGDQMGMTVRLAPEAAALRVTCDFHMVVARDALAALLQPLGLDYRVHSPTELVVFRP